MKTMCYRLAQNVGYFAQKVRFLGLWEHFHNPEFNYLEFEAIEREAGWVEQTGAYQDQLPTTRA